MADTEALDAIRHALAVLTYENCEDGAFPLLFAGWDSDDFGRFVVAIRGVVQLLGARFGHDEVAAFLDEVRSATIDLELRGPQ